MTFFGLAKRCTALLFFLILFAFASASRAEAQQLSVSAVNASVTVQPDGSAQATFSIQVTNKERRAMTNFFVVFADGTTATLDDVAPQGTVVSQPQTLTIDVSQNSSVNI